MRRNLNKGDVSQGREDHEDHNRQAPLQRDHYHKLYHKPQETRISREILVPRSGHMLQRFVEGTVLKGHSSQAASGGKTKGVVR